MTEIQEYLFLLRDEAYKSFTAKINPAVDKSRMIGVRMPNLRAYAKKLAKTPLGEKFLSDLPHTYYEENCLHAYILTTYKDYDTVITLLDAFLPYVDNWATCDSMRPNALIKQPERFMRDIQRWLSSNRVYTVRFAIEMLMNYFLDSRFTPNILPLVYNINSDEYYVIMMQAWFFAEALSKQWQEAVKCLQQNKLSEPVLRLTVKKCRESLKITAEQKEYLKTFLKNKP